MKKLYLAGPDVFLADALAVGQAKQALCRRYGFDGLFPLDQQLEAHSPAALSAAIYQANVQLMQQADAIIANISPFRSSGLDAGTAFEIGFFAASGKPVYLYSNDPRSLKERVECCPLAGGKAGVGDGMQIEDFGDGDNLMIIRAASLPLVAIAEAQLAALQAFEQLLGQLAR